MHAQVQKQYLNSDNQVTAQTNNQLTEIYEVLGHADMASECCERILCSLASSYPFNHTAVAYQKLRLADLLCRHGEYSAAQKHRSEALRTLSLHFGDAE